ncbi:MAG: 50S ribosomal protein L25 [Deltaproteobacteria bacterium]
MEEIILDAQLREEIGKGKVKDLRGKGFIPAVLYGEGKTSLSLKVSHHELMGLIHHYRLENAIINLKIKDDKKAKPRSCLIKETQYDPVTGDILHVDFNEISLTKTIKVNVPIVPKGEPAGVKQEGGSLERVLWEIEVECLPVDIPKEIEIDVSNLKMGDSIHVKDLAIPANVKVLSNPEAIVVQVVAPIKEEVPVEAAVEGEEKKEPEVIKEKKEVPEEEAEEGKEEKEKEKK